LGGVFEAVLGSAPAFALTTYAVVGPNAYANIDGDSNANEIFANRNITNFTVQIALDSSQLASVPNGAMITGIGFRLVPGAPTVNKNLKYSSFDVQVGPSVNAVDSLDPTFTANEGAGTITAMSGPLTIPAGSLLGGQIVNPFFVLDFTTPYQHQSGETLLLTLSDTIANAATERQQIMLDALSAPNPFIAEDAELNSYDTDGYTGFFNTPIVELTYTTSSVPEVSAWALMLCGFGMAGGALRLRPRQARSLG
jgi:hypothetical protein